MHVHAHVRVHVRMHVYTRVYHVSDRDREKSLSQPGERFHAKLRPGSDPISMTSSDFELAIRARLQLPLKLDNQYEVRPRRI